MSRVAPSRVLSPSEFYGHNWLAEHLVQDLEDAADALRREAGFIDGKAALLHEQMTLAATLANNRLIDAARAVVDATQQCLGGDWIITGDGEKLIGDLAAALREIPSSEMGDKGT